MRARWWQAWARLSIPAGWFGRNHALTLANDLIQPGDIVLVKGSHSVEQEHTAERLAHPGTGAGDR